MKIPRHGWCWVCGRAVGIALIALLSALALRAQTITYYVDEGLGSNSYNGLSDVVTNGDGPKLNISAAITIASNGSVIVVDSGYYQETEWDLGTNNLTLNPQGTVYICGADLCQADTVGDGIDDWWRLEYFGTPTSTNSSSCASCDPEGDGFTNLEKFQYGMDPLVMYSLTVPAQVNSYSTGNPASVTPLGDAATYTWSIDNGTVTAGQNTPTITWTAGDTGTATINVSMQLSGLGPLSANAFATVNPCVLAAENLTIPSSVITGSVNTASLPSPLTVLYSDFTNGPPYALTAGSDTNGNFYGVFDNTDSASNNPVVTDIIFKMTPAGLMTNIYQFDSQHVTNGWYSSPLLQGVSPDTNALYGTTYFGGTNVDLHECTEDSPEVGYGTVYRLTQQGTLTTLHIFTGTPDGAFPQASLVQGLGTDSNSLYGVTDAGGSGGPSIDYGYCVTGSGTVFRASTTNGGTCTILHRFAGATDGAEPSAALVLINGFLYGTTSVDGSNGYGTIFAVPTNGSSFTTLHAFNGTNGAYPFGALLQGQGADSTNLYGTTLYGDANGDGTVFQINTNGTTFAILHQFSGSDGSEPRAGLSWGYDGYMYGTTALGGSSGNGTIFRTSSNSYFLTVYNFTGGADGGDPDDSELPGKGPQINTYNGYLYGTTTTGGSESNGTIYQFDPASYTWAITNGNGTITAGKNTTNITWTAGGTEGVCSICVTISENQVCTNTICTNITVTGNSILPAGTTPNWIGNVGVEGGIPTYTNTWASYTTNDYSPSNPGLLLSNINASLATCPASNVVFLAAGAYPLYPWYGTNTCGTCMGGISISTNGNLQVANSYTVLRGAGTNTVLHFYGPGNPTTNSFAANGLIDVGDRQSTDPLDNPGVETSINWTSGFATGSSNIVLATTSGLYVGQMICLDQTNNDASTNGLGVGYVQGDPCWDGAGQSGRQSPDQRSLEEWCEITAINGVTVTIDHPLVGAPNVQWSLG
jgi:uncharacterized repeat protein (TIGR03803 family)